MAGPIRIAILADARRATKAMRDTENSAVHMGRKVEGVNGLLAAGFEKMGTALAALGLAEGLKEAAKGGIELQAAMQGTQQVFGKAASGVLEWSKTTAGAFGVSRTEALQATKQFGAFFTAVGINAKQAAKMSENWTVLAANLAAFGDLPTADALDSITSALRGELDPLQKYIPTITAAAIQQRALADTGKKSAKALTAGEKAAALNALMLESVANKAGAAERKQQGLNTQLGELKAKVKDARDNLGTMFLPALTAVVDYINNKAIPALKDLADKIGPKLRAAFEQVKNFKIPPVVVDVSLRFARSDQVQKIIDNAKKGFLSLGPVLSNAFSGLTPIFKGIGDSFARAFGDAMPQIKQTFSSLASIVSSAFSTLTGTIGGGVGIITALWRDFGGNVRSFVYNAFRGVVTIIQGTFQTVAGIFKTISSVINGDWSGAWEGIKTTVQGVGTFLLGTLQVIGANVRLLGGTLKTIALDARNAWDELTSWVAQKWHEFTSQITAGTLPLVNSVSAGWDSLSARTQAAWTAITARISAANAVIRAVVSGAIASVQGRVSAGWAAITGRVSAANAFIGAVIRTAWQNMVTTVSSKISAVTALAQGLRGRLTGALSGAGTWLLQTGVDIVRGLIRGIDSMIDAARSKVSELASLVIQAAHLGFLTHSPSKVFIKIGQFVGHGFIIGLTSTLSKIQSTMDKLTKLVTEAFTGKTRAKWLDRIKSDNAQLQKLAKQRDAYADKIKAAQSRLSDLIKAKADVVSSVRDTFTQSFQLVDQSAQDGATSIQDILDRSSAAVKQAALFAQQLIDLKNRGLSPAVLQELAAAGPQAGAATAQALANASQDQLAQLNDNYKQLAQSGTAAGNAIGSAMYDAGIKAVEDLIKGLRSKQAAIDAEMRRIAARLQAGLRASVGIKTPAPAKGKAAVKTVSASGAVAPISVTVNTGVIVDKRGLVDAISAAINEVAAQLGRPIKMSIEVV
jgi:phage-related protein